MMTISVSLWSCIPMPISSTVTTQQIVRMMKRGENGVISVSMESPGAIRLPCCSFFQPTPMVLILRPKDDNRYETQFVAVQRRSMAVGAQLARNTALLQPALRQPGIGGPDCPRNMILGPRKVIG